MYRVYLFEQLESVPEAFIQSALLVMPEERRQKAIRYRQSIDRNNCVITYLMLKIGLKECFHIVNFTLRYGKFGKPYLAEYPNVYFNISHCKKGCVVAVADQPIGIDIQEVRTFSWEIAKKVCCDNEIELLKRSLDRDIEFTGIWAKKESYVKMLGKGIGINLTGINTLLDEFIQVNEKDYVISICTRGRVQLIGKLEWQ